MKTVRDIYYGAYGKHPRAVVIGAVMTCLMMVPLAIHYYNRGQEVKEQLHGPPADPDVLARRAIAARVEGAEFEITKLRRPKATTTVPGGDRDYWYEAINSYEYAVSCRTPDTAQARAPTREHLPKDSVFAGDIRYQEVGRYAQSDELTKASLTAIDALHSGSGWIAWQHATLRISFDRCVTWIEFEPWKHVQPGKVLYNDRRCETEHCALITLRQAGVSFSDLEVSRGADAPRVSFVMTSPGLAEPAGVAVSTMDGGKTWRITERDASVAAAPVAAQPEATQASAREIGRLRGLTDEELQAIPTPAVRGDRPLLIARIREAARRGNVEAVKRARIKDLFTKPGDDVELYRDAVVAAMQAKAQSAPQPPPVAALSPYALDEADLARIAAPRLQDPSSAALVADIRTAARAGSQSRVMALGLSAKAGDRDEIDRFMIAVTDAMVAKGARAKPP